MPRPVRCNASGASPRAGSTPLQPPELALQRQSFAEPVQNSPQGPSPLQQTRAAAAQSRRPERAVARRRRAWRARAPAGPAGQQRLTQIQGRPGWTGWARWQQTSSGHSTMLRGRRWPTRLCATPGVGAAHAAPCCGACCARCARPPRCCQRWTAPPASPAGTPARPETWWTGWRPRPVPASKVGQRGRGC